MAARGSAAKEIITKKILEIFEGSFMADAKTIRIPIVEDGETIEIKVALTAAKDILGGAVVVVEDNSDLTPPTEDEKQIVENFVKSLGF